MIYSVYCHCTKKTVKLSLMKTRTHEHKGIILLQSRYLKATSEEEIFAHLGLEYVPPSERNA